MELGVCPPDNVHTDGGWRIQNTRKDLISDSILIQQIRWSMVRYWQHKVASKIEVNAFWPTLPSVLGRNPLCKNKFLEDAQEWPI